jgi:hypothetical protein
MRSLLAEPRSDRATLAPPAYPSASVLTTGETAPAVPRLHLESIRGIDDRAQITLDRGKDTQASIL